MKLKKRLVAMTCAIMVVVSMMGITSFALTTYTDNPKTFTTTVTGKFLTSGVYPGWTTTRPTTYGASVGYDDSLKRAVYRECTWNGVEYKELFSDNVASTAYTVMTSLSHDVSGSAVKRENNSYIFYASNQSSGIVELKQTTVIKPQ